MNLALISIIAVSGLALTGCASNNAETKIKDVPAGAVDTPVENQVDTPIEKNKDNLLKTVGDLEDATVDLKEGQGIIIDIPDVEVTNWTAEVADSSIARFVAGNASDNKVEKPAIATLKSGSTAVVLTNVTDGDTIVFNINIK